MRKALATEKEREEEDGEAKDALAGVPDSPARAALLDAVGYVLERRA